MRVIDIDPKLLQKEAEAAVHAADESWIHMEAEYVGKIPELMETLVPEGPYAYTILPQVLPDGTIKMPILSTREEIREAYKFVRGRSDLLSTEAIVEIRGTWYTFTEAVSRGRVKGQDSIGTTHLVSMFPVSGGKGITGELVWPLVPRANLGRGPVKEVTNALALRRHVLAQHDAYLKALRGSDVEGILETMNEDVMGAVRDYVNDTGTLISLDGKAAHRAYYQSLFKRYDVVSVDVLDRLVQEWYTFAELRFTMRCRDGAGGTLAFNTAEFFVPGNDDRIILRIGHGTDPASAES